MKIINLVIAGIAFLVTGLIFFIMNIYKYNVIKKGKEKSKKTEIIEVKFLSILYNIKKEKLLKTKFMLLFAFLDAFIIAGTYLIVMMVPLKVIWQLMIGFVLLLGFIYALYGILGRILVMKGYDK